MSFPLVGNPSSGRLRTRRNGYHSVCLSVIGGITMYKISAVTALVFTLLSGVVLAEAEIMIDGQEARFSGKRPDTGSVFLRIKNTGLSDDALVGAEVNIKGFMRNCTM
jgi:hypothetical protein